MNNRNETRQNEITKVADSDIFLDARNILYFYYIFSGHSILGRSLI